jgi:hypothetical protein
MQRVNRWVLILLSVATLGASPAVADELSRIEKARNGLADIWQTGSSDLYLPFRTHHLRFAYDRDKIDRYDERPFGLGYGRSKFDRDGDWHGLYAIEFQDSHFKPNYMAGYAFQTFWRSTADWRVGGGLTAFLMTRPDIAHYTPFPGVLPVGSVSYKNVSLETAYLPGGRNVGNILFFWGRIHLE